MSLSKEGFKNRLEELFKSLEPIAKNAVKSASAVDTPVGVRIDTERGDIFLDPQAAKSFAKAIATAEDENIMAYIRGTVVGKINELVTQYNRLRADAISHGVSTTAQNVKAIPTN
jgi:hypothetical protein